MASIPSEPNPAAEAQQARAIRVDASSRRGGGMAESFDTILQTALKPRQEVDGETLFVDPRPSDLERAGKTRDDEAAYEPRDDSPPLDAPTDTAESSSRDDAEERVENAEHQENSDENSQRDDDGETSQNEEAGQPSEGESREEDNEIVVVVQAPTQVDLPEAKQAVAGAENAKQQTQSTDQGIDLDSLHHLIDPVPEIEQQAENGNEKRQTQVKVASPDGEDELAETSQVKVEVKPEIDTEETDGDGKPESVDATKVAESNPKGQGVQRREAKAEVEVDPNQIDEAQTLEDLAQADDQEVDLETANASRRVGRSESTRPVEAPEPVNPTTPGQATSAPTANQTQSEVSRLSDRLIGPARNSGPTPAARTAQQTRLIGRVARAFEAAQQRGGGPLRIRLHPRELGALKLELQVEQGVMTAKLEVETQAARTALLDSLPNLRERLDEQGIRVEQFDVGLSGGGDHAEADLAEQQAEKGRSSRSQTTDSGEAGGEEQAPRDANPNIEDGGLNVIV